MYYVPWLKFLRISALPSALADVFGGTALAMAVLPQWAWGEPTGRIWALMLATTGIYLGGMGLNDILHLPKDRKLLKERPLAVGQISLGAAIGVTAFLYAAGLAGAFIAGCFWPALGLALFTIAYNDLASVARPKPARAAAGVATLALCRALNVSLPLWAFAGNTPVHGPHATPLILMMVCSVFGYFVLVTLVSLFEDRGGGAGATWLVQAVLLPAVFTLPVYLLVVRPLQRPILGAVIPLAIGAILVGILYRALGEARRHPTPRQLGKVVGKGIRGECLLMAAFGLALMPSQPWLGLIALGLYPLASGLSFLISPT